MQYESLISSYDEAVKQRHPAILTAIPVAFPELVRVRVQVLDDKRKRIVQVRDWTPLLPWSRIEKLPMHPGVREQSEQFLRDGKEAPLGTHLLVIDLDDCSSEGLESACNETLPAHGSGLRPAFAARSRTAGC